MKIDELIGLFIVKIGHKSSSNADRRPMQSGSQLADSNCQFEAQDIHSHHRQRDQTH